ncbi:type I-E CRISPR-associated protein Cse1/CasA [Streptomyces sp. 35G-GA-8]|uniref:type I-E CRISPR-associated protein Cse1/CasA n=1 Tax=Streptomyces sp. 35G-GA-8 TaxID=2939434 RepID=UPI00201EB24C|nr:type I-E CRISPR-associated protein Cse1/CasA [Streptomyces sp. 35G-GA-8]MCL7382134.1 type I-E CRISPR-associated protein Cse1/CasA [Streptomyces sp. 35G-GA-8]
MPGRSHNLIEEPLFPVRWRSGARLPGTAQLLPDRVGLRQLLLRSHDIAGLAIAEPPAHSAVLRILYALTARVTGLDERGPGDWSERREEVVEETQFDESGIDAYFDRWAERFFLFDEDGGRPWMQDARLVQQCDTGNTAGVNKLIVTRPAGQNHSWLFHASDRSPDRPTVSEAVLHLLVWHYYGPAGRCSSREVGGVKSASVKAGPLRAALSYHPEGDSLFQTLLAGLPQPDDIVRRGSDLCPWEWDELPDPDAAPPKPSGPCSRLTACSQHALLLVPDEDNPALVRDAFITWAYRNGLIPRDDPYLIWQISQQGNPYARPANSNRALWRDVDAVLGDAGGSTQARRPAVFRTAYEVSETLRVRALGFEQDRAQAKDTQFVDASTPPVLGRVEEDLPRTAAAVKRLRQLGELYGQRLDRAVRRAWALHVADAKADGSTWAGSAGARYWPLAEAEFWDRFRRLDRAPDALDVGLEVNDARQAFLRSAEQTYEAVTTSVTHTKRGARAVSTARIELYGGRRQKPSAKSKETTA